MLAEQPIGEHAVRVINESRECPLPAWMSAEHVINRHAGLRKLILEMIQLPVIVANLQGAGSAD